MRVLICGAYSDVRKKLIQRLKKEKHEIFVLSGKSTQYSETNQEKKPKEVFEIYHFPYHSRHVQTIVENIAPEIIIFFGAWDTAFSWSDYENETVTYLSGLTNVLMGAKKSGTKKFVYLSTLHVFDENSEKLIYDTTKPCPEGMIHKAIAQGEDMCAGYHEPRKFEVSILRLPDLCGIREIQPFLKPQFISLYEEARNNQKICIPNKSFPILHVEDSIEVMFLTLKNENQKVLFCNISDHACLAEELEDVLKKVLMEEGISIEIEKEERVAEQKKVAFKSKSLEPLAFTIRRDITEGMIYSLQDKKHFLRKTNQSQLSKKKKSFLRPFVETTFLYLIASFLSYYFPNSEVDFFLVFIVCVASVQGATQTFVGILMAVVGKFFIVIRTEGMYTLLANNSNYIWMLQLMIVGVIISFFCSDRKRRYKEQQEQTKILQEELKDVNQILEKNVYIKNIYEKRLLNYKDSLAKIFEITGQLDTLEPNLVMYRAIAVIRDIMETDDVSIYTRSTKSDYFRLTAASSKEASRLGKSFHFDDHMLFYEDIMQGKIYRNTQMDPSNPLLVGTIYEGDQPQIFIMIWWEKLERINLYQVNLLQVLCKLIENSMNRAMTYMQTMYEKAYIDGTRVLRTEAFNESIKQFEEGRNNGLIDYICIRVQNNACSKSEEYHLVEHMVRDSDVIGEGKDGNIYIILSNSRPFDMKMIKDRFAKSGFVVELVERTEDSV